jgi:hypothetical protein
MPVQWESYIGPLWRPATQATAWDYSNTSDHNLANTQGATVSVAFNAGNSTLTITGLAGLPAKGGIWIGPNGSGQGWEYFEYSSRTDNGTVQVMSGLIPEAATTREHNGNHSVGASARFWVPFDNNNGELHFVEEMDSSLATTSWSATMQGVMAARSFVRKHHAIYVRTRTLPGGSWTSFCLGWIEDSAITDDSKRYAQWEINICSIAGMLSRQYCPVIRIGELDLARASRVVKSAITLVHPYKERNSGDYIAGEPDLTANSLIDGDNSTLCIFERTLGGPNRSTSGEQAKYGDNYIGQANLSIPAGLGPGYRWLQIYHPSSERMWNCIIATDDEDQSAGADTNGSASPESRVVLVENVNKFYAMFPLAEPTRLREIGAGFFDILNLNPVAGESLGIMMYDNATGWEWGGTPIAFGAVPPSKARWMRTDSDDIDHHYDADAIDIECDTPTNGKTLTMQWKGSGRNDHFELTDWETCCYAPDVSPWVLIQLPRMGLKLYGTLTSGYTGTIQISDGAGLSTNGLQTTGTIQIGGEQMTYNNKTDTTLNITGRGANGTPAAAHDDGDTIYMMVGTVASDAYPIDRVTWTRPAGTNAPRDFTIRMTNMITAPRTPATDDQDPSTGYTADYPWWTDVTNHASTTYTYSLTGQNIRPTYFLLQIHMMQAYPARPRLNTLQIFLDTSVWANTQWLPTGSTIAQAYTALLTQVGIPAGAIGTLPSTADAFNLLTGEKPAWSTLADMADYTATMIKVSPMSLINIYNNGLWRTDTTGSGSFNEPSASWDRTNLKNIGMLMERANATSQVRMTWLNEDGSEGGVVVYPSAPTGIGNLVDLPSTIFPDGTKAANAIQRRFAILNYPETIALELATGDPSQRTGVHHQVYWDFPDGTSITRKGLVQSIDHILSDMRWETAIRLLQIREANY